MKTRRNQSGNNKKEGKKVAKAKVREPPEATTKQPKGNAKRKELNAAEAKPPPNTRGATTSREELKNDEKPSNVAETNTTTAAVATSVAAADEAHADTKKRRSPRTKDTDNPDSPPKKKRAEGQEGSEKSASGAIQSNETQRPLSEDTQIGAETFSRADMYVSSQHNEEQGMSVAKGQVDNSKKTATDVDDGTLDLLLGYLENRRDDPLDDDDLITFGIKMNRVTQQQLPLASQKSRRSEQSMESDDDSDDDSCFAEILDNEQQRALGHDLMKKLQSEIQAKRGGRAFGAPGTLERKTVQWVRRAAGIGINGHRKKGFTGRISSRRFTRKQARADRQRKRERGLDILNEAISELENEDKSFPKTRRATKATTNKKSNVGKAEKAPRKRATYNSATNAGRKQAKVGQSVPGQACVLTSQFRFQNCQRLMLGVKSRKWDCRQSPIRSLRLKKLTWNN